MNDLETEPEVYPWDRTEPYVPGVSASLIMVDATLVETFDHQPHPDSGYRVVGVRIGDLTIHLGLSGGDAETVSIADKLIVAIETLRAATIERMGGR